MQATQTGSWQPSPPSALSPLQALSAASAVAREHGTPSIPQMFQTAPPSGHSAETNAASVASLSSSPSSILAPVAYYRPSAVNGAPTMWINMNMNMNANVYGYPMWPTQIGPDSAMQLQVPAWYYAQHYPAVVRHTLVDGSGFARPFAEMPPPPSS